MPEPQKICRKYSAKGSSCGSCAAILRTRRLTTGDKDSDPRWSPDGRYIAFTAKRKDDAEPQVYVIAADGGDPAGLHLDHDIAMAGAAVEVVERRAAART